MRDGRPLFRRRFDPQLVCREQLLRVTFRHADIKVGRRPDGIRLAFVMKPRHLLHLRVVFVRTLLQALQELRIPPVQHVRNPHGA